jgi:uncharacterized protein (TIGR02118 family)
MYKLVILIEPPADLQRFDERWPEFLHLVEAMPGLQREASSRIDHFLFGATVYSHMHELYFDTLADAEAALSSMVGQAAGGLLQQMTGGRMTLFLADHKEDDIEHLARFRQDALGSE